MHLSSYWFIAALPSTARKEHCIWLTSRAQWSLSSPCKELAERRMFGVGKNGKALTLQMTLESFSKMQHHCVLSWSHGITECYTINPQTDKQTQMELDFCKTTTLVSVRNREHWILKGEQEEAPRAGTPGTALTQYLYPPFIRSKMVIQKSAKTAYQEDCTKRQKIGEESI